MFLLDTVVLSELRKRDRNPGLTDWMSQRNGRDLFLSVISIGEIERRHSARTQSDSGDTQYTALFIAGCVNM